MCGVGYEQNMDKEKYIENKMNSISLFTNGIAHDFSNILTIIQGNISLAKMQIDECTEAFAILIDAEYACESAKDLIRQLYVLSGDNTINKKIVSVSKILKNTKNFCMRDSKIICEFSIPDNLWYVNVFESQIYQVFSNIVINALQAMPESGIIKIKALNFTIDNNSSLPLTKGKYVRISIKDNGIGIHEKHLTTIFNPYFTTKKEGKGLGLAITNFIIQKHNGYITVNSQVGKGTTFYIFLPAFLR